MNEFLDNAHELALVMIKGFQEDIQELKENKKAILFSGGLDSSIIATVSRIVCGSRDTTLYTVGTQGCRDHQRGIQGAEIIDMHWKGITIANNEIFEDATSLLKLIPDLDFLELSYELPLFIGNKRVEEEVIITGQGADELFGGYARYLTSDEPFTDMEGDRKRLLQRTVENEKKIVESKGKVLITPFLNESVWDFVSGLSMEHFFGDDGSNKVILREAARILGLPEFICSRPKLAAQYGSGISKVLKKMRKRGELRLIDDSDELASRF